MKKIALVGFDNLLGKCLELVLKSILKEEASISQTSEKAIKANYNYDLIILHTDGATPDSSAISLIRELRKNGYLSPIIAFVFSEKNIHNVFSKKAHKYFKYPIMVKSLKDTIEKIKEINQEELNDFYKLNFCDQDYMLKMLNLIPHHVRGHDWKKIGESIRHLEICRGTQIATTLRSLLGEQFTKEDKWENEINRIKRVLNEL